MEGAEEFNLSNDVAIELGEFFGRNPVFSVFSRAGNLDRILGKIATIDLEAQDVAGAAVAGVPVTRDLDGKALVREGGRRWAAPEAVEERHANLTHESDRVPFHQQDGRGS
jgi:hypothetical protein